MRHSKKLVEAFLLLLVTATLGAVCPPPVDLDGTWDISYHSIRGGAHVSATLQLTANSAIVSGDFSNAHSWGQFCDPYTGCNTYDYTCSTGPVSGSLDGQQVVIQFACEGDYSFAGTLHGDRIVGDTPAEWEAVRR